MIGQRIGLGMIVAREPNVQHRSHVRWLYLCECGMARYLRSNNLKKYPPKSHNNCRLGFKFVAEEC